MIAWYWAFSLLVGQCRSIFWWTLKSEKKLSTFDYSPISLSFSPTVKFRSSSMLCYNLQILHNIIHSCTSNPFLLLFILLLATSTRSNTSFSSRYTSFRLYVEIGLFFLSFSRLYISGMFSPRYKCVSSYQSIFCSHICNSSKSVACFLYAPVLCYQHCRFIKSIKKVMPSFAQVT